jgi:hypothetical protein
LRGFMRAFLSALVSRTQGIKGALDAHTLGEGALGIFDSKGHLNKGKSAVADDVEGPRRGWTRICCSPSCSPDNRRSSFKTKPAMSPLPRAQGGEEI